MLDLRRAAERIGVYCHKIEHLVEPGLGAERRAGERVDEGGGDAVALGVPLVFLRDGAADPTETGVAGAVAVERAHRAAEKRRDGDGVVEPRATVGDTQFD